MRSKADSAGVALNSHVRGMRPAHLLTAIAALVLLLPGPASAAPGGGSLPDDGSALEQYVESIPDGKGGRPSTGAAGDGSSSTAPIGGSLKTLGADGEAAAQLAGATAPDAGAGSAGPPDSKAGSDGAGKQGSEQGSAPGFQVDDAAGSGLGGDGSAGETIATLVQDDGSEGLGVVLPLILLAILLVALGATALRSRRAGRGEKTP
jgi:hypothetical protein